MTEYDRRRHGIHNLERPEVIADPRGYVEAIGELGPLFFDEVGQLWVCSGYREAARILSDFKNFSSARGRQSGELAERGLGPGAELAAMVGEQMLFTDPPSHSELRAPLREQFSVAKVRERDDDVRDLVRGILDRLPGEGRIDLVGDLAGPLPSALVAYLLGMPGQQLRLGRWADGYERLLGSLSSLPDVRDGEVVPILREAMAAFTEQARARLAEPADDLIGALAGPLAGLDLDDAGLERRLHIIAANCVVLVGGGYQTLTQLVAGGLLLLERHPEQQRALRERPELIDSAIDEFMRINGSSQYVARQVTADVEIGGVRLRAGQSVLVHLGAANLDPTVYEDPHTLDITRRGPRHLGFGLGRHYCAGAPYAQQAARWAILGFLERYPHYETEPGPDAVVWGKHANTRAPARVRMRVSAGEPVAAAPLSKVDAENSVDLRALLERFNDNEVLIGEHRCWHHLFERWARTTPNAIAVRDSDGECGYAELDERANALARTLRSSNVQPESVVAVVMERSVDFVISVLAVAKAGGAFLLAAADSPAERLRHMLHDASAELVLADERTAARLRDAGLRTTVLIPGTTGRAPVPPVTGTTGGNTAYAVFTSGTTGQPKGIVIDHLGVVNLHLAQRRILRITPADRVLQFLSPSFDGCVFDLVLALTAGATLEVARGPELTVGPPLIRLMRERAVTAANLTPSVWAALPDAELPDLRLAMAAGERLPAATVTRWHRAGRRFCNLYGPAETAVWATWHDCVPGETPPIGSPVTNKRVYVLDEDLRPVGIGVPGEICVGGLGVGRYLSRPELMETKFTPDPFGRPGELLYRTGDVGQWLPSGSLEFLGRRDRQVKIRGQRVELDEIERTLALAPGVAENVVIAANGGLEALIVPAGTELDEAAVREYLAARLHTGMVPAKFTVVDELPRTDTGKRRLDQAAAAAAPPVTAPEFGAARASAPATDLDGALERLVRLFADCLRVPAAQVDAESDFFAEGGDSLALSALLTRIEQEFGTRIDVERLLDDPSPIGVARAVTGAPARLARTAR
ncbi:amino acid adenylation domain-containing protein [Amycolatopsis sp. YIM 10]|uniref:amino acid adenylation domain-containing protein n=1 Tax=Amycolatopsis sp. YIM 10 TaxID=2653857 RepID=UPI00129061F1|nr:amino acid adenylation domain-containing protein [Amycolatopsis sp. YIM 10]QFU89912.1 Linear gramicidin synthase subunit D [Amycolatopsis sp. YIM 10]